MIHLYSAGFVLLLPLKNEAAKEPLAIVYLFKI
jgi:hypothetical protein